MAVLSPVTAREAVHVLILRELAASGGRKSLVLKGGVNLRLFFGSVRYSADLDLDGDPRAAVGLNSTIKGIFANRNMSRRLRELGIRGLDPGGGPNKDTPTTFRYKFGIITSGDVRFPTKVEISYRERSGVDEVLVEAVDAEIARAYLPAEETELEVPHYSRTPAVRQKISVLAGRALVQVRDLFDLYLLSRSDASDLSLSYLAEVFQSKTLEQAHDRALGVSYGEYRGQVLEFLSEEARARFEDERAWDEVQLSVVGLIERIADLKKEFDKE
ncbi:MAG: nucleotidyl transferase AbiEii/AbiGii toxin family protein [Acidobacteriota bacterium]